MNSRLEGGDALASLTPEEGGATVRTVQLV
jgi:hypothetical protein